MPAKTDLPRVPEALLDLALIDGPSLAAAANISLSAFQTGVRETAEGTLAEGEVPFPQPTIRRPRFTRYRMADARAWLIQLAERGAAEASSDERTRTKARRASEQARDPVAVAKGLATRRARAEARKPGRAGA